MHQLLRQLGGRAPPPRPSAAGALDLGADLRRDGVPASDRRGGGPEPDGDGHVLEPLQLLQRLDDGHHPGPVPRLRRRALHGELRDGARALDGVVPGEPLVHDAAQPAAAAAEVRARPVDELHLLVGVRGAAPDVLHGAAAREELQEHDAEAVHVAPHVEVARLHVLGRRVPVRAHHPRRHVRVLALGTHLGQPEVGELRREVGVEEDVGRLEVAVDHRRGGGVQER